MDKIGWERVGWNKDRTRTRTRTRTVIKKLGKGGWERDDAGREGDDRWWDVMRDGRWEMVGGWAGGWEMFGMDGRFVGRWWIFWLLFLFLFYSRFFFVDSIDSEMCGGLFLWLLLLLGNTIIRIIIPLFNLLLLRCLMWCHVHGTSLEKNNWRTWGRRRWIC